MTVISIIFEIAEAIYLKTTQNVTHYINHASRQTVTITSCNGKIGNSLIVIRCIKQKHDYSLFLMFALNSFSTEKYDFDIKIDAFSTCITSSHTIIRQSLDNN